MGKVYDEAYKTMSRKGNCWDNAPMESFWGKLKQEWLNDFHFLTRADARREIFWYQGNISKILYCLRIYYVFLQRRYG